MTFDSNVESEQACINLARNQDKGACVQEDGTCKFATREDCNAQETRAENNASTLNPNVGFHKDMLCSNSLLGTVCAKQQYTNCVSDRDEVYWYDSCGNQENIYSSNKEASYNQGYVLSKEKSCTLKGAADPSCGNCDYTQNNLCGEASAKEKPKYGNYICQDLNCPVITEEDTSPSSSTPKRNGESWCAFDSKVGFGQDLVGSRQFRRLCINGKELTEPCKDYREEMCIQGVQGTSPLTLGQSIKLTGQQTNYVEAACRDNRWETCKTAPSQKACENIATKDCQWVGAGIDVQHGGSCIPFVPPGLPFWPDKGETKSVPNANAKQVCSRGNQECTTVYEKGGLSGSWKCIANCECQEQKWLDAANQLCIAQGDCGAYYNYIGDFTSGGAKDDHPGKTTIKSVASYHSLVNPIDGSGSYGFSAFFKKSATPFMLLAGIGIYSAFAYGSSLLAGVNAGLGTLAIVPGGQTASAAIATAYAGTSATTLAAGGVTNTAIIIPAGATMPAGLVPPAGAAAFPAAGTTLAEPVVMPIGTSAAAETALPAGSAATAGSTIGVVLAVVGIIAIIWVVYNLFDVLLASTKEETVSLTCNPWVAPTGGSKCEECGKDGKPCSEYRCRSLGQLCKLVNEGTSKELCTNTNPNDVNSPIIKANKADMNYTIQETVNGYTLTQKVKPFTPVHLSITTNEPSQCKYALNTSTTYNEMPGYFGETLYDYNHTMLFSLPAELAEPQVLKITNGGNYQLFLKCQDQAGNTNNKDYYIKFGIQPGPDLTPPSIELTSIANGAGIAAGTNMTPLTIYVNEPSECKWSKNDIEYTQMENNFVCNKNSMAQRTVYYGLYECIGTLQDIKSNQNNNFYFRCKDQPGKTDDKRNVNIESYDYTLRGTVPLKVTSTKPTGTLYTSNVAMQVTTSGGADNGKEICGFSKDDYTNAIDFVESNSNVHNQPFSSLATGNYRYNIYCIDSASNQANGSISFSVSVDTQGPQLTRVYKSGNILYLETHEDSSCEYNTKGDFTYGQGTPMTGDGTAQHEATLDASTYFVRCKDNFNNVASYKIYP